MKNGTLAAQDIVLHITAHSCNIPRNRILNASRGQAKACHARQTAMYLMHVTCGISLTHIGKLFCRDRTTVAHACKHIEDSRDNPDFDYEISFRETAIACLIKEIESDPLYADK